jgi:hypothetical protein
MLIVNILISVFKFSITAGLFFVAVFIGMHVIGFIIKTVMYLLVGIIITVGNLFVTEEKEEEK